MTNPLSKLHHFAPDREIAIAIVGKQAAEDWLKTVLPALERRGFPAKDPLHGMRAVRLVERFYDAYFGITAGFSLAPPDGEERLGQWKARNKKTDPKRQD